MEHVRRLIMTHEELREVSLALAQPYSQDFNVALFSLFSV